MGNATSKIGVLLSCQTDVLGFFYVRKATSKTGVLLTCSCRKSDFKDWCAWLGHVGKTTSKTALLRHVEKATSKSGVLGFGMGGKATSKTYALGLANSEKATSTTGAFGLVMSEKRLQKLVYLVLSCRESFQGLVYSAVSDKLLVKLMWLVKWQKRFQRLVWMVWPSRKSDLKDRCARSGCKKRLSSRQTALHKTSKTRT